NGFPCFSLNSLSACEPDVNISTNLFLNIKNKPNNTRLNKDKIIYIAKGSVLNNVLNIDVSVNSASNSKITPDTKNNIKSINDTPIFASNGNASSIPYRFNTLNCPGIAATINANGANNAMIKNQNWNNIIEANNIKIGKETIKL